MLSFYYNQPAKFRNSEIILILIIRNINMSLSYYLWNRFPHYILIKELFLGFTINSDKSYKMHCKHKR